jgi:MFS family permease
MTSQTPAAASGTDGRKLRRVVIAAGLGNVFEGYDFIVYGSLATVIARNFFSEVNPAAGLIFTLLAFAAGFFVRPFGALVFGAVGDRVGRKKAFLITISIMGAATFAIGLLPTYRTAGILAPLLLITMRLLQGLSFGGEYGGALTYMAEHSPRHRRGLYCGWIQTAAGIGLFVSLVVIQITRTALGEDAFVAWGWRLPFLLSLVLLILSVWLRLKLEESPVFKKLVEEGKRSKAPIRESFLQWGNIKLFLIALFGLMATHGVLWYTAHFYAQFFLERMAKMPSPMVTLVMVIVTGVGMFSYVLFGWLSDFLGRKKVIITAAILLTASLWPLFHALVAATNPALAEAQRNAQVVVVADPSACSVQFDPIGRAQFLSSCDIAKNALANRAINYSNEAAPTGMLAEVKVGGLVVTSVDGRGQSAQAFAPERDAFISELTAALHEAGYPDTADPARINLPLVIVLMLIAVILSTAVFGPIGAAIVEIFPTRIRYTASSLPYNIGAGWFGGFLPTIGFALVAATGNIYSGLWFPIGVATLGIVVTFFLAPETKDRDLQEM